MTNILQATLSYIFSWMEMYSIFNGIRLLMIKLRLGIGSGNGTWLGDKPLSVPLLT